MQILDATSGRATFPAIQRFEGVLAQVVKPTRSSTLSRGDCILFGPLLSGNGFLPPDVSVRRFAGGNECQPFESNSWINLLSAANKNVGTWGDCLQSQSGYKPGAAHVYMLSQNLRQLRIGDSEMKNRIPFKAVKAVAIILLLNAVAGAAIAQAPNAAQASVAVVTWKDSLKQKPEWYSSDEALRIADNVLLYQHNTGGWSKNIDMAKALTEQEKAGILKLKPETDSNIDNGSTFTQLAYLAKVYNAGKLDRHRTAFLKGIDYLLEAQQSNSGWPQYFPLRKGYYTHITFNDGAMIGVMKLLNEISQKKSSYAFVDEDRRGRSERAVARGIELILKTQVMVDGKLTVWGAQHDEVTLAPAPARAFEPASLTGGESVGIVRFLMGIKQPEDRVIKAVESAIAWFEKSKLTGIKWEEKPDASKLRGYDRIVVKDPNAAPLWARFYEIKTNRPIFIGRDSKIKYDVMEIEEERRTGYSWYVDEPAKLLAREYPAWQKRVGSSH